MRSTFIYKHTQTQTKAQSNLITHVFHTGCMFDKVTRHFYDDTCVVPEKTEGEFLV